MPQLRHCLGASPEHLLSMQRSPDLNVGTVTMDFCTLKVRLLVIYDSFYGDVCLVIGAIRSTNRRGYLKVYA